jgi:hypothetical protein
MRGIEVLIGVEVYCGHEFNGGHAINPQKMNPKKRIRTKV